MEAKVSFHVRRFLRECEEKGVKPSEDTVTTHLRDTYGEYTRKPQGALKKVVAKVLKKAQGSSSDVATKRARSESSDEDERMAVEFEKQAALSHEGKLSSASKRTSGDGESRSSSSGDADESSGFVVSRPNTRYSDFGGIQAILQEVKELIEYPLTHPEVYAHLGVEPPRGILLHGPPGTGKTMLANAIAGESGACFLRISAPEIVSGMSGESEQKLRELFDEAIANAPSIIFIDEIDAITPKRETSQRGMEKRIVAQLLTSTDSLSLENTGGKPVLIIGATNRPDALDSALRRAGRFDREICLGIPDEDARERILQVLSQKMKLDGAFDFRAIARRTPGFVGADLVSLTKEAAVIAVNRIFSTMLATKPATPVLAVEPESSTSNEEQPQVVEAPTLTEEEQVKQKQAAADGIRSKVTPFTPSQLAPLSITMDDFLQAVAKVQPSSKREGFATIPDVTWADIGALASVRDELVLSILHPIQNPERFEALGLKMPAGVLLYGPPGCGKTLLAKAIANESGANFISIKGPELLDKYVGESERAVRQVFQRARASSPCVVFFDELDALAPRRSGGAGSEGGNGVSERVVNQLLTEMDGLDSRKNVFVIAATNRPDIIDPAMLRPGRLDKLLYVNLPVASDRLAILKTVTKNSRVDPVVSLHAIAHDPRCEGFSGADLSALVREAGISALRETDLTTATELSIQMRHFDKAFETVFPSVSRADQRMFDKMKKNLRKTRSSMAKDKVMAVVEESSAAAPTAPVEASGANGNAMEIA
uniref:AAA+ ATPase domain-containing protein n=1 Tax=Globisporangium ultimum (strain ATCC 200006 / CBS 805.95 / DAOM BR144) TaxID=431595 RepID=K3WFD0_GLOUD